MNPTQILLILRARYRLVLLVLLATLAAALATASLLPPRYKATLTLVVDFKSVDPITGAFMPVQLMLASYMATEIDILESQAVALKVVKALRLDEDPRTRQKFRDSSGGRGSLETWLADALRARLEVKPAKESRLIEVNFTSPDPEFSARVANAFGQAYVQTNLEMKVAPARESASWFDAQLKQLQNQLEAAQARLTKYQSENGITSTDQRLDVEASRLSELSTQLVQAQNQVYESVSRQKQLQQFMSSDAGVDSLPEVLASPVIHDLKGRLSMAESRLSQASTNLGVNHPEYRRAQSEVAILRAKLRDEVGTAAAVIGNNLKVAQTREHELREAVAAQKARLIDLNRRRDDLGMLVREVDNAQRAYDSASQRHTQTSLESRVDQSNVTVLSPAVAPIDPSFPKYPAIIALALVVGTVLGAGFALAVELIDRRVRGADDLQAVAGVPVWGVLTNTGPLARNVARKNRQSSRRGRFLRSLQEPTLG
ncbi:MAG TPA: chain length determinant protein EpsF [Burkholderiales bacterium]|nr:chain length determinant protein EpsF [Burkholderiales bacterium]